MHGICIDSSKIRAQGERQSQVTPAFMWVFLKENKQEKT